MILVTGATGLVGQHLLKTLVKKDKPIRALFRTEERQRQARKRIISHLEEPYRQKIDTVEWFGADITDIPQLTKAFENITEVYHCAGLVSFDIGKKDELRKVNIEGTANMVNIALDSGIQKFCHMSSVAALGDAPRGKPIRENTPRDNTQHHNYYEISKYGGEMEVWRASQEGLPVVIVNPTMIVGAGNWNSGSGQLFSRVAGGFPFRVPRKSGFVSVDDVVSAMIALMESPIKNERFILVSEIKSIAEITDQIAHYLQCKPPKINLKKWMVSTVWLVQAIGHLLFKTPQQITRESRNDAFGAVNFDNSKIKKSLGFAFSPISQALEEAAYHYKKEHQKPN